MGTLHVWGECDQTEDSEKSCQLVPYVQERTEKGLTRKGRLLVTASRIPIYLHTNTALVSACGLLAEPTPGLACPQKSNGAGCLGFRNFCLQ